jgi:tetratricopeptide (TPR) repeat protein
MLIYVLEKTGNKAEAGQDRSAATEAFGPGALPPVKLETFARLDRVMTELDTTTLQMQIAAREPLDGTSSASVSASSPAALVRKGRQELISGGLEAAEADFRAALAASPKDVAAHRGLAELFRRKNRRAEAIQELQAALESRDSAMDRTTLARIYLEQRKPDLAKAELARALKLAPNYSEARQLMDHLQNGKTPAAKP